MILPLLTRFLDKLVKPVRPMAFLLSLGVISSLSFGSHRLRVA